MDGERVWRCHCGGSHYITVRPSYPGATPTVDVLLETYALGGWRYRVRRAWAALVGRPFCEDAISLSPDDIHDFVMVLQTTSERAVTAYNDPRYAVGEQRRAQIRIARIAADRQRLDKP